ncbi:conserved hypothetical protein [Verticillium alfalfae VaMs.102]|uniref:Uncharacterized protein n=1 Tax=Verticillium alfalfae (strain VaMs.102 / ATCC MYA-4576 / FGSC 10136) TaxID=526221 RepID=C9SJI8_VERA1|nr:conserved hypothetical protein [Verticillium alfalfae VaMs.102]EEY18350.1 conserved hypothetical protein [Verticillium alfalfae VaMs.102]
MASFAENLWNSVFTPGTTPTLLYATNASFAALQLTLLALLAATRSIHFVILSVLCAGLWRAINWFAAELAIAQAREAADNDKAAAGGGRGPEDQPIPRAAPAAAAAAATTTPRSDTAVDQAVRTRKTAGQREQGSRSSRGLRLAS